MPLGELGYSGDTTFDATASRFGSAHDGASVGVTASAPTGRDAAPPVPGTAYGNDGPE
jgi:hypothetical protein